MTFLTFFLVMVCFFESCSADLDNYSCSWPIDGVEWCSTNKDAYVKPFPVVVDTSLNIRSINKINEDKNSISLQVELYCKWKDPGFLVASNLST